MISIPRYITDEDIRQHPRVRGTNCLHNPWEDCVKADKISWNNNDDTYVHVRFDGCICRNNMMKKCDCIIFRFGSRHQKPVAYVIETKKSHPDIREVQRQIQTCIDTLTDMLPDCNNLLRIVPVVCARAFHGLGKRVFFGHRVIIYGEKEMINKRLYGQDINAL